VHLTFENLLPVVHAASLSGMRSAVSSTSIIPSAPCYSATEQDRNYEQCLTSTHVFRSLRFTTDVQIWGHISQFTGPGFLSKPGTYMLQEIQDFNFS
jgi:hypothetical protein